MAPKTIAKKFQCETKMQISSKEISKNQLKDFKPRGECKRGREGTLSVPWADFFGLLLGAPTKKIR